MNSKKIWWKKLNTSLSVSENRSEEMELIQISHEVGESNKQKIEGHQTWRLHKNRAIEYDDFSQQDTT